MPKNNNNYRNIIIIDALLEIHQKLLAIFLNRNHEENVKVNDKVLIIAKRKKKKSNFSIAIESQFKIELKTLRKKSLASFHHVR